MGATREVVSVTVRLGQSASTPFLVANCRANAICSLAAAGRTNAGLELQDDVEHGAEPQPLLTIVKYLSMVALAAACNCAFCADADNADVVAVAAVGGGVDVDVAAVAGLDGVTGVDVDVAVVLTGGTVHEPGAPVIPSLVVVVVVAGGRFFSSTGDVILVDALLAAGCNAIAASVGNGRVVSPSSPRADRHSTDPVNRPIFSSSFSKASFT